MSLAKLIELGETIKLEFSLGITRGYSIHELNRLKDLLNMYDDGMKFISEEIKKENNLPSLTKVRTLIMNVA